MGYGVSSWRHESHGGHRWLIVELTPLDGATRYCSGCDESVAAVHDRSVGRIRNLPVFDNAVELWVPRLRLTCAGHEPRLERLDWLARHARGAWPRTWRGCSRVTSILHAARWFAWTGRRSRAQCRLKDDADHWPPLCRPFQLPLPAYR